MPEPPRVAGAAKARPMMPKRAANEVLMVAGLDLQ